MMDSILQDKKECFITGCTAPLHKHHIFFGRNRKASEEHGFWVWLVPEWHNMMGYSAHKNRKTDLYLKEECQRKFEETHSREEFMAIIGRNYLGDKD